MALKIKCGFCRNLDQVVNCGICRVAFVEFIMNVRLSKNLAPA